MSTLPITAVLPGVGEALRDHASAVLQAEPGAGKTTRVPPFLAAQPWLDGRIVMLEPRRMAARAAARYMAQQLNEEVGGTVGFRVRGESRVSARTRIEVVTEGVLTRMLLADPALDGTALVIFDEFHERSIHADLGLALIRDVQRNLRPELRVLLMSATMESEALARLLGSVPVIRSAGRAHPVETHWLSREPQGRMEDAAASAVLHALRADEGDILVFLPGAGEIGRCAARLAERGVPAGVRVHELHGSLSFEQQDRALAPAPRGTRKVVLATSIAETSLTIEGIGVVIDAGWMRVPRFSPRTGMSRLETLRVTRDAADQRRGRAGRTGPGICHRLWTAATDAQLQPRRTPEILETDLAPLVLDLAAWGAADPGALEWLDVPPAAAVQQARTLLRGLGALDDAGSLTPHGRAMAATGTHPRIAHMLIRAGERGSARLGAELAAILGDRDLLRGSATPDADVRLRLHALRAAARGRIPQSVAGQQVDRAATVRAVAELARMRIPAPSADAADDDDAGAVLALAYPDRIAQRRPGQRGRFLLSNGRGAMLPESQPLAGAEYLVAAELADQGAESRIHLAAPVTLEQITADFADEIETETRIEWDDDVDGVQARTLERLGALTLRTAQLRDVDDQAVARAVTDAVMRRGIAWLPWTDDARRLQARIAFLRAWDESFPDAGDHALAASLDEWLAPYLDGVRRRRDIDRLDMTAILTGTLDWRQRRALDESAPTHFIAPTGSRIPIDYTDPSAPFAAVRLQELFGLADTPRLAGGRLSLTLHLLSPARRPVQVTRDLASFWKDAYFEVRKDLKGRYPKHYWPDDPMQAEPTRRLRRK